MIGFILGCAFLCCIWIVVGLIEDIDRARRARRANWYVRRETAPKQSCPFTSRDLFLGRCTLTEGHGGDVHMCVVIDVDADAAAMRSRR